MSDIFELVKADLDARNSLGFRTYGKPMTTGDGRDALQDAYEEALDLCMYLKKAMLERAGQFNPTVPKLTTIVVEPDTGRCT